MTEQQPRKGRPRIYEGGAKRVTISLPSQLVNEFRQRGSAWVVKKLNEEINKTNNKSVSGTSSELPSLTQNYHITF